MQSGSPAINAGANLGYTLDYENKTVPQGSAPDMGAYEFGASATPTPTLTPVPGTTTIDDSVQGTGTNQFNYVGSWGHATASTGDYNQTSSYSNVTNDSVTLAFTGSQVKVYGVQASHHGIAAVSIDGGAETNIDQYAATRAGDVLMWTSPVLASGNHTFKLRVTGTKSASTDYYVVIDRMDVIAGTTTPTPLPTTATINASPASATITTGTPVTVDVVVDGGGQAFNAAQATVTVSPNLSITSLTAPSSNPCNFTYTQTPTTSNPSFAGAMLATSSQNCTVYRLSLTPLSAGTGTITFTNASVKAYATNGEILSSVQNGSYTLVAPTPTPTNTPIPTPTPTNTPTPVPPTPTPTATLASPTMNSVTSPTYQASAFLSGTKTTAVTTVSVNGSAAGTTYPTATTWQATLGLNLGTNTVSVYGSDSLGNQSSTNTSTIIRHKLGDIDGDSTIDLTDISLFATDWQKTSGFNYALSDMNTDNAVDLTDFSIIAKQYGQ